VKKAWHYIRSLIIALLVVEGVLWLLGFRPYHYEGFAIQSEPSHCFIADSTYGFALNTGSYEVTLNDSLVWNCTVTPQRQRAIASPSDSIASTLFMAGDSYSFGWGIDDELAYPSLVQKLFPNIAVTNATCPGYGTLQALVQLQELDSLPQVVVVNYCSFHDDRNALTPFFRHNLWLGFGEAAEDVKLTYAQARFPQARLDNDSLEFSYCEWNEIYSELPLRTWSATSNAIQTTYEGIRGRRLKPHEVSEAIITEISLLCEANNSKLIVCGITKDELTEGMMAFCESIGIRTCYMGIDLKDPEYHNAPHDTHPSAKAHAHFAGKLAGVLKDKN
jgi:hypothetical protein